MSSFPDLVCPMEKCFAAHSIDESDEKVVVDDDDGDDGDGDGGDDDDDDDDDSHDNDNAHVCMTNSSTSPYLLPPHDLPPHRMRS